MKWLVVAVVLAVAAPASAGDGLTDPAVIAVELADHVTYSGLWFANADCETRFGTPGTLAAADRGAFASCIAQLALESRGTSTTDYFASAHGESVLVTLGFDGTKLASFAPLEAAGSDAALPVIAPWFAQPALDVAKDARAKAVRDAEAKVCFDVAGKATSRRIYQSSGVTLIDAALIDYLGQVSYQPPVFGGKALAACTIAAWYAIGAPNTRPTRVVLSGQLDTNRTGGTPSIPPDAAVMAALGRSGRDHTVGAFSFCLADDGALLGVDMLSTTGFPGYDHAIETAIRSTWKFKPWLVDGKPVAVCSAVHIDLRSVH
jgi:hypothetical protein